MSNSLAIAAVTHSLRHLLEERFKVSGSGNVTVTTKPLDKARDSNNSGGDQVNLFLYQYTENAAWKNMEIPSQVKPGETGYPPLALNLQYLITVYAQNDDFPEPTSHKLLGESMSVFHDHSILSPEDIKASLPAVDVEKYDLYNQIERVKITLKTLPEDELNKFWTIFQVPFRFTFVCEVSVVLIESTRPTKIPSPVLKRGTRDQGVDAQASLIPPFPTLTAINFTDFENAKRDLSPSQAALLKKPAAQVGEKLTLTGYNLDGTNARALFNHPLLPQPIEILQAIFEEQTATEIKITIPDQADQWLPGLYTVTIELTMNAGKPDERRLTTNGLPLPLAQEITKPISAVRDIANPDTVILTAQCKPSVSEKQQVSLILTVLQDPFATAPNPALGESLQVVSDRELLAKPRTAKTATLEFEISTQTLERLGIHSDNNIEKIRAGTYPIRPRLRIDGIDSLIVDYLKRPPEFIDKQDLVIP